MSKYNAKKTEVDNIIFDSKAEARCYGDLKLLLRNGDISNLKLQPKFDIVVNGKHICYYYADFEYEENGMLIVIDVKGVKTAVYRLKKKLTEAIYGIKITEVQ